MIKKIIKTIVILGILGLALIVGMFAYAYKSVNVNEIAKYAPDTSTEILDRNGKRIAYIFKKRHRLYATYNEIPFYIIEGVVAMEDTKFFEHKGVNPDAIARAILKDIKARAFVEGGSTITQQLIKNMFLSRKKKLSRKLKEMILAYKIEKVLSKEDILERYLNIISYGHNYLGVKTAAEGYFRKDLSTLTLKESAMLVGIPNAPTYYNPLRHYDRVIKRANLILYRLKKLGWITDSEYKEAKAERPKVYKTSLSQNIAPYIVDEVVRRFKDKFKDLKTGGYRIFTTIDLKQQQIAKKVIIDNLNRELKDIGEDKNRSDLNGALVSVENKTGDILAMVGGIDYKKSPFNRATMTKRQPGSAFKPFVYQTALDYGYNPATKLTDLARTFKYKINGKIKYWTPKNYERNFKGFIPLREALVESRNLATVNLVDTLGLQKIRRRLARLDVDTIPNDLSISLGNLALSPYKMAQIYTIFSNKGHMIEPRLVSKIVSRYNSVLYETQPKEILNFTKPKQAFLMTSILEDVIKRGTGKNARVKGIELAGKTGTTNNYIDAWFCGYSPTITTIIWYGRDKYKPIAKGATGGRVAAPAFANYYREILKINPKLKRKFDIPKGVFIGSVNGKNEYYTSISPLPKSNNGLDMYEDVANPPLKKKANVETPVTPKQNKPVHVKEEDPIDSTDIIEIYDDQEPKNSDDVEVLY